MLSSSNGHTQRYTTRRPSDGRSTPKIFRNPLKGACTNSVRADSSLQQAGRPAIAIPEWLSFRLTSAWPGLIVMVLALTCAVTGAIRSKVLVQKQSTLPSPHIQQETSDDKSIGNKPPVPAELTGAHDDWFRMGINVQRMLVVLAIVSVVSSLAVTAFEPELSEWHTGLGTRLVAFIAAVAAGLLGTFSLVQKNHDIWTSWRAVQGALMRYRNDQNYTFEKLTDVYDTAEQSLGNVAVGAPTKPDTPARG
jgi:hypothetical protein